MHKCKRFISLVILSGGSVCAPWLFAELDTESVAKGETVYQQICMACHAPDMEGGIGPNLIDPFWKNGDTPEAIFNIISEGVPNTEMIPYKSIFSEEQIKNVTDFILSKQEGLRSLVRAQYPRNHFKDKRFAPELFETVESMNQSPLRENLIYFPNRFDGVAKITSDLYVQEDAEFKFNVRKSKENEGRTSIYVNGEEVFYRDYKVPETEWVNTAFTLSTGVHKTAIYHEERMKHALSFHMALGRTGKGHLTLMGRSLAGSEPKVILAGHEAKVIRKWVAGISPRSLLCLLPNKVIVAYNAYEGRVESAWKEAWVDQTPSLPDRSASPSVLKGNRLPESLLALESSYPRELKSYSVEGDTVKIESQVGGVDQVIRISPEGANGFKIEGATEKGIAGFKINVAEALQDQSAADEKGNFSLTLN